MFQKEADFEVLERVIVEMHERPPISDSVIFYILEPFGTVSSGPVPGHLPDLRPHLWVEIEVRNLQTWSDLDLASPAETLPNVKMCCFPW